MNSPQITPKTQGILEQKRPKIFLSIRSLKWFLFPFNTFCSKGAHPYNLILWINFCGIFVKIDPSMDCHSIDSHRANISCFIFVSISFHVETQIGKRWLKKNSAVNVSKKSFTILLTYKLPCFLQSSLVYYLQVKWCLHYGVNCSKLRLFCIEKIFLWLKMH